MAYQKLNFKNNSAPFLNEDNLNAMDSGIAEAHNNAGITNDRPDMIGQSASNLGYFDTDLGHIIYWNGTAWVDALGNALDTVYITKE